MPSHLGGGGTGYLVQRDLQRHNQDGERQRQTQMRGQVASQSH